MFSIGATLLTNTYSYAKFTPNHDQIMIDVRVEKL